MQRKSGFTLIELLVVIAIIAILAAILFPVFAQSREKARQATCVNNEKQMGLGLMQYTQDYDEHFPFNQYFGDPGVWKDQHVWGDLVYPYVKSGDRSTNAVGKAVAWGVGGIFTCPSYREPTQNGQYGVHLALMPDGTAQWNTKPVITVSQAALDAPAERIMVAEKGVNGSKSSGNWNFFSFITDEPFWISSSLNPGASGQPTNANYKHCDLGECLYKGDCDYALTSGITDSPGCGTYPRYRHHGTTNTLFADGHVKAFARGRIDWYRNIYLPGIMSAIY